MKIRLVRAVRTHGAGDGASPDRRTADARDHPAPALLGLGRRGESLLIMTVLPFSLVVVPAVFYLWKRQVLRRAGNPERTFTTTQEMNR